LKVWKERKKGKKKERDNKVYENRKQKEKETKKKAK
jgi:hypothetical protein